MKLTRDERLGILHADWPRLVREKKPCEPGAVIQVSSQVTIEALAVKRTKKGEWRVDYLVRDQRPNLLLRVPPTYGGKRGQIDAPTATEIEQARSTSSYTHSHVGAVSDAGEHVPAVFQNGLVVEARERFANHRATEKREEQERKDFRAATAAVKEMGVELARAGLDTGPLLAGVRRVLDEQARRLPNRKVA